LEFEKEKERRALKSGDAELVFNKTNEDELEGKTEDEIEMMKTMGFCGFNTTKEKTVVGNNIYCANIVRKRRYRQYMNRRGGFNRPLDFIA